MASSKSATPVAADHPAMLLRIGTPDEKAAMARAAPVTLPNDDLVRSLQQKYPKDKRWLLFRNDYRYIYVVNWMYQFRGYIKSGSEHFDVDSFEIELFNLVNPPPLDDLSLVLHRARLALISRVHGRKVESLAHFELFYRHHFGMDTPLGAIDEDAEDVLGEQPPGAICFDDLYVDEKIDILYTLIMKVTQYADFREYVERHVHLDFARPHVLFSGRDAKQGVLGDFLLVFDGTAMYKRTVEYPVMEIPAKRRQSPRDPEHAFGAAAFDAKCVKYDLIYKDIYALDAFIEELKVHRNHKKNRLILEVIKKPAAISNVFDYETRKRRVILSRKKENDLALLLATRKKSSRLEAKQLRRNEEEQDRRLSELEALRNSSTRRSRRNMNSLQNKLTAGSSAKITREERWKLRKGPMPDFSVPGTLTPEVLDPVLEDGPVNAGAGETEPLPVINGVKRAKTDSEAEKNNLDGAITGQEPGLDTKVGTENRDTNDSVA